MANALYDKGRGHFALGDIHWSVDTIRMCLLKSTYTVNLATHEFFSDLSTNHLGGTGQSAWDTYPSLTCASPSAAGICDATNDPINYPAVAAGSTVIALCIYKALTSAALSPLIAYIDTGSGGAISITTNGGDINVTFDNGTNKVFKL